MVRQLGIGSIVNRFLTGEQVNPEDDVLWLSYWIKDSSFEIENDFLCQIRIYFLKKCHCVKFKKSDIERLLHNKVISRATMINQKEWSLKLARSQSWRSQIFNCQPYR